MDKSSVSEHYRRRHAGAPAGTRAGSIGLAELSALALLAVAAGGAAAQPAEQGPLPVGDFDADWFEFEAGRAHIRGLRGTQGELSIRADDAFGTDIDTDGAEWRLRGNVRIGAPQGTIEAGEARWESLDRAREQWLFEGNVGAAFGTARLQADYARFVFEDDALVSGELSGTPATFEDRAVERPEPVRGTADRILYDARAQSLRLSGNVTVQLPLREGHAEYSGCDLVYDLARQGVTAGSSEECGEPLHFRIPVPSGSADPPPAP